MLEVLKDVLARKKDYLRAEEGSDFEDRVENKIRERYSKIRKEDIDVVDLKSLKVEITKKDGTEFVPYKKYARTFVKTPFGSQNYPDFILFTGEYAIPLEIKYSKKSQPRPVWNSGLPRPNGIYIFGSYGLQDITFFLGRGVISDDRRRALVGFFSQMKHKEIEFRKTIGRDIEDPERRGFMPYVRIAYQQEKISGDTVLSYFFHPPTERDREKHAQSAFHPNVARRFPVVHSQKMNLLSSPSSL